jgi:hypothetical protein
MEENVTREEGKRMSLLDISEGRQVEEMSLKYHTSFNLMVFNHEFPWSSLVRNFHWTWYVW